MISKTILKTVKHPLNYSWPKKRLNRTKEHKRVLIIRNNSKQINHQLKNTNRETKRNLKSYKNICRSRMKIKDKLLWKCWERKRWNIWNKQTNQSRNKKKKEIKEERRRKIRKTLKRVSINILILMRTMKNRKIN